MNQPILSVYFNIFDDKTLAKSPSHEGSSGGAALPSFSLSLKCLLCVCAQSSSLWDINTQTYWVAPQQNAFPKTQKGKPFKSLKLIGLVIITLLYFISKLTI